MGYNNFEQGLECARHQHKPLAIYFTANTCKNCTIFENEFLNTSEVSEIMNNDFVFIQLYVDDQTVLPIKDQFYKTNAITDNKVLVNTIGALNLTLLSKYNHSSHPSLFLTDLDGNIKSYFGYDPDVKYLIQKFKDDIHN